MEWKYFLRASVCGSHQGLHIVIDISFKFLSAQFGRLTSLAKSLKVCVVPKWLWV